MAHGPVRVLILVNIIHHLIFGGVTEPHSPTRLHDAIVFFPSCLPFGFSLGIILLAVGHGRRDGTDASWRKQTFRSLISRISQLTIIEK
jgi:hypothetical protein